MIISNAEIANGKWLFSILRTSLNYYIMKVEKLKNIEQNKSHVGHPVHILRAWRRDRIADARAEELC